MKLTVIKDNEKKNIEVPNIARYANSQNKVTELDLSSNNPFFVRIESLSRKKYVVNPENNNQSLLWYFERVKGQYRETINKLTPSMQRKFKEQNPTKLKFLKSDIAKYINLYNQKPHIVSRGSQKNFIDYTKGIAELVEKDKLPGENFYKELIGNAIIFKTIDKLFGRKNVDAIGDTNLKSFTVAYTTSFLHHLTNSRIDLWKIYSEQIIHEKLIEELKGLLVFVYNHLIKNAANTLISEYSKKESSWKKLREEPYKFQNGILDEYLVSEQELRRREKEAIEEVEEFEDNIFLISEIRKLGLRFWDGLKTYVSSNNDTGLDYLEVFDLNKKLKDGKNLGFKEIRTGKKGIEFIKKNRDLVSKIKNLSSQSDEEIVEIKALYDRVKLIDAENWKRIIAIGEQTKCLDYQEISNIKYVSKKIQGKELVKENSLIKCYESLKRMKKFNIKF
jgi:hypothetical protein